MFKIDVPLDEVQPAFLRRTVTIILFPAMFFIGIALGMIVGASEFVSYSIKGFLVKCWNGPK